MSHQNHVVKTQDSMSMNMDMDMDVNNNYMHTSLYWGTKAIILFPNWPGHSLGMYVLALFLIFFAAVAVEFLSTAAAANGPAGFLSYALRVGLSYAVMLSVMSFNAGVLVAAVAGHAAGFFAVSRRRSKISKQNEEEQP